MTGRGTGDQVRDECPGERRVTGRGMGDRTPRNIIRGSVKGEISLQLVGSGRKSLPSSLPESGQQGRGDPTATKGSLGVLYSPAAGTGGRGSGEGHGAGGCGTPCWPHRPVRLGGGGGKGVSRVAPAWKDCITQPTRRKKRQPRSTGRASGSLVTHRH